VEITAAHWVYLLGVVSLLVVMIARKNVVVPAVIATFLTALAFTGSLPTALSSVFRASLTAASELFTIFLIIALVTALLAALKAVGAERPMVAPFQRLMINGPVAYLVLFVVTYLFSLFFWPTPTLALIAAILLPAAIRAGLSPMGGAIAIALSGQGMALASDYRPASSPTGRSCCRGSWGSRHSG
jgi:TRAP-type C4-dicarboxylate transport system permease large subunit